MSGSVKTFLSRCWAPLLMAFLVSMGSSSFATTFTVSGPSTGLPVTAVAGDIINVSGAVIIDGTHGFSATNNVTINMAAGSSITVNAGGNFAITGTAALQPRFTSTTANPGDWLGITFNAGSIGNLQYAIVEYARTALNIVSADTVVQNCIIRNLKGPNGANGGTGAPGGAGTAAYGILVSGNSAAVITGNTISNVTGGKGGDGGIGSTGTSGGTGLVGNNGATGNQGANANCSVGFPSGNGQPGNVGGAGNAGGTGNSGLPGGTAGSGGASGEAAGIFLNAVINSSIVVQRNTISAIVGGAGGAGGQGGQGGAGGAGGNGGTGGVGGKGGNGGNCLFGNNNRGAGGNGGAAGQGGQGGQGGAAGVSGTASAGARGVGILSALGAAGGTTIANNVIYSIQGGTGGTRGAAGLGGTAGAPGSVGTPGAGGAQGSPGGGSAGPGATGAIPSPPNLGTLGAGTSGSLGAGGNGGDSVGIGLSGSFTATVAFNTVVNINDGAAASGAATAGTSYAVLTYAGTGTVTVKSNMLVRTSAFGAGPISYGVFNGGSLLQESYNDIVGFGGAGGPRGPGIPIGTGSISVQPTFVSAVTPDYHLDTGSAGIDAADPVGGVTNDIDQNARETAVHPNIAQPFYPDMGADETIGILNAITGVTGGPLTFGTQDIDLGPTASQTLTINNTGKGPLRITAATLGGLDLSQFTITGGTVTAPGTVPAGGSRTVTIAFDPTTVGAKTATVTFANSDATNPSVVVNLSGTGTDNQLVVTGPSGDFGTIDSACAAAPAQVFTITNNRTTSVTVNGVTLTGTNAGAFAISGTGTATPYTLTAGASRTVTVNFPAALPAGAKTATLHVVSTDVSAPTIDTTLTGVVVNPEISVSPASLTFGSRDIADGATASQTITISNLGTTNLTVTGITLGGVDSADFLITLAPTTPDVIGSTASDTIQVAFDPNTIGSKTATITINADDCNEAATVITLNGTGTNPQIQAAPTSYDFGDQDVDAGPTATHDITVTNTGTTTLNVTGTSLSGANFTEFVIGVGGGAFTVAPAGTHIIKVAFNPGSTGAKTANLDIASDALSGPFSVTLLGNGIDQNVSASPAALDFGTQDIDVGPTASQTVTITNTGSNTLAITSVTLTGTNAAAFTIVLDSGELSLAPNASRTVVIAFDPLTAGNKTAALTIVSDDTDQPSLDVTLTGVGANNRITVSPGSFDFGAQNVTLGATGSQNFLITNNRLENIDITGVTIVGSDAGDFLITADTAENTLTSNTTRVVTIVFDPNLPRGAKSANLKVESTDIGAPVINGLLEGTAIAQEINFSPGGINFGGQDIDLGATPGQNIVISNPGTDTLTISSIILGGLDISSFVINSDTGEATLAPGGTRTLNVSFSPLTTGPKTATLTVNHDATNVNSPSVLPLDGSGTHNQITVAPASIDFGTWDVDDGPTLPQTVTISNNRSQPLTINSVTLIQVAGNAFQFGVDSGETTLAPGGVRTIEIVFDPNSIGNKFARLSVNSSDPQTPILETNLTGEAVDQSVIFTPDSVDFGLQNINLGPTATQSFFITNNGNAPLAVSSVTLTGPDAADFNIFSDSAEPILNGGEVRTVKVNFDPTTVGDKVAALTVVSDDNTLPNVDLALAGTGTNNTIDIHPASLQFVARDIDAGPSTSQAITISNDSLSTITLSSLTLQNVSGNAFSTSSDLTPGTLAPGDTRQIDVVFDPASVGAKVGLVTIESDDATYPHFEIDLTGEAIDQFISVSPTSINFGTQDTGLGSTPDQVVVISNTGDAPLSITSVTITGTNPGAFFIFQDTGELILAPGTSRVVQIKFDPNTVGAKSANLEIISDDTNNTPLVNVALTGTAVNNQITVSPGTVPFGDQDIDAGPTATLTVIITNNRSLALTISSITITGANAADFNKAADTGQAVLNPGAQRTLSLEFNPTLTGSKTAILTVNSDDPVTPAVLTTLTGNGTDQNIDVSGALNFGTQDIDIGPTAEQDVTITNTGTANLSISSVSITAGGADFSIFSDTALLNLAPGQSRTVSINFDPTTVGAKTGTLTILSDDTDSGTSTVALSGTGTNNQATVGPTLLDFGSQDINAGPTNPLTVTITNNRVANITVGVTAPSDTNFTVFSDSGETTLAPNASRTVRFIFDPTTVGIKSGTVTVTTSDPAVPSVTINLTGESTFTPPTPTHTPTPTATGTGTPGPTPTVNAAQDWTVYE